jgi:hypothetical protein
MEGPARFSRLLVPARFLRPYSSIFSQAGPHLPFSFASRVSKVWRQRRRVRLVSDSAHQFKRKVSLADPSLCCNDFLVPVAISTRLARAGMFQLRLAQTKQRIRLFDLIRQQLDLQSMPISCYSLHSDCSAAHRSLLKAILA